jgi:hypothetical protein
LRATPRHAPYFMRVRALHRCLAKYVPAMQQRRCSGCAGERGAAEREREQQSEAGRRRSRRRGRRRGRRARSLTRSGNLQHDRAWPARHESPALPFGERESELDCARAFLTTSSSVEAPMCSACSPCFSPPIPHFMSDARSISSRFPLRRESGAHRLEIGPFTSHLLVLRGHVCQHIMTCHLLWIRPRPPSPSTPVLHCWLPEHIR